MTARPVLGSSQSTQWKVELTRSVSRVSCIFSSSFPACYRIVQCFLQDSLGIGLFTESQEKEHFRTSPILELVLIFIYMLYSWSTACKSKYYTCISWKRPVGERFRVPRRLVPVWNVACWAFCANCHQIAISCVPVFQANSQLVPARNLNIVFYQIGSDLLVKSTESLDAQNNKTNKGFPQAQLKRFKMNPAHMKSIQAQTKNKTQKSLSNHPRHKYSPVYSCPTLKVLRLIGQWIMVYTIDSLNGASSRRTF